MTKRHYLWLQSTALLLLTSLSTLSAQCDRGCQYDPYFEDPCRPDPRLIEMNHYDYELYADFLWWQTSMDGQEFATLGGSSGFPELDAPEQGCVLAPKPHFEPGFRVGLSFKPSPCCDWSIFGQYTYLYSNVSTSASVAFPVAGLRPTIKVLGLEDLPDITKATGDFQIHYNVMDLGFGKVFCIDDCFDLRPFLGIKAAWQELNFDVTYLNMENTATTSRTVARFTTDFQGVGLRGGFNAAWRFSHCFAIEGQMALSGVYSDFCPSRVDIYTDNILATEQTHAVNVNLKRDACVLIPVVELLFGVKFVQHVCGCYDVTAFAGWENQVWMDFNRNLYAQPNASLQGNGVEFGPHGNLIFQGLTARLAIAF